MRVEQVLRMNSSVVSVTAMFAVFGRALFGMEDDLASATSLRERKSRVHRLAGGRCKAREQSW